MKLKNQINKNYKFFKLKLIKSKIYKKNHALKNIELEDIEFRLKKALCLIYLFHINNKKILFIGNPMHIYNEIKKLLKNTKHIFIPLNLWLAGTTTNQKSYFKSLINQKIKENQIAKKTMTQLKQIKEKSDLVVIMDETFNNQAIEENYNSRLPIIVFNSNLNPFDEKSRYKIPGNFISSKNKLKNNFFYSILYSTLKKSNATKKYFPTVALYHKFKAISILKKIKNKYYKKN